MAADSVFCPSRPGRRGGLAGICLLFGCQFLPNAIAENDTRSLTMHHMHTGEDITITYKRDGKYDDAALDKLNWFLRDWRRQEQTRMDPHLLDIIWEVNREVGGDEPIQIVCGYRSPATNALLRRRSSGVARFSQHMLGKATDFYIPGVALDQIRNAGLRLQRGGVGFYPTSGSPFIHLDTGNVRHWPYIAPELLARVMREKPTRMARNTKPPGNDDRVAEVAKPKPSFVARLFGFTDDTPEPAATATAERAPATASRPDAKPDPAATKSVRVAAAPPARSARAAGYTLASLPQSPADIVRTRAEWQGEPTAEPQPAPTRVVASATPGAVGSNDQRFVWLVGPAGRSPSAADEPPRPQAEIPDTETTASTPLWSGKPINDRVPTELALAYAAPTPPELRGLATQIVRMVEPSRTVRPAAATSTAAEPRTMVQKSDHRIDDPWLRGLVVAPSLSYSMSVAVLGAPDYRSLTPLLHKPSSAIEVGFGIDSNSVLASDYFDGPAVSFVQTVTFARRTAGLN